MRTKQARRQIPQRLTTRCTRNTYSTSYPPPRQHFDDVVPSASRPKESAATSPSGDLAGRGEWLGKAEGGRRSLPADGPENY